MKHRLGKYLAVVGLVAAMGVAASTSGAMGATANKVHTGGTLNIVAVGSQWPQLDPALDTQDAADVAYLSSIFGQLIELQPGGSILGDMASSWAYSHGNTTLTLTIRKGVTFSNGDPYTAADVAWSINRDLLPAYGNIGDVNFPLSSTGAVAVGNTVVMNTINPTTKAPAPDTGLAYAFINEAPNYTVDQTALNTQGEAVYTQSPIGAGPFTVVSNTASARLQVAKNPHYWQKGHPYLAGIIWTVVGNDQSAVAALQSGQAQLALGVTTIPLLKSLPSQGLVVTKLPKTVNEFINLNSSKAPFNDIRARQAVEYATNSKSLNVNLYSNVYTLTQSESAPGQLYYSKSNKYYLGYNLAKAQALVQQLGGLTVSLCTTSNTPFWINEVQAIATMWEAAGIKVNIQDYSLQQMLGITFHNTWQAIDENWGPSVDPVINDGQFFKGGAVFSGTNDANLNGLLNQAAGFNNPVKLAKIYTQIANVMNQNVYSVWMYAKNAFDVSTKNLVLTTALPANKLLQPLWEDFSLK